MATRRLYYDDAFKDSFSAQVLSCTPLADPVAGFGDSHWGVLLDQTHLYPTSGGQPNDLGKLGDANVVDVRDLDDDILHVVDRPVAQGRIDACVHWPRRFDHMQQHTAQHLISAVFQERFGLVTVSFHLGERTSTIDLRGPQPSEQVLEGAARAANAMVFEDREITVRYGTAEQFAEIGVRKKVERTGILRAIEIAGIDLQPCGGTHVRRTGQIGTILLRGSAKMRQDWRVDFVAGGRAEAAARKDAASLTRLAAQLECAPEDVNQSVDRLLRESEAASKRSRVLVAKLAEAEAAARLAAIVPRQDGVRLVAEVLEDSSADYLQLLATAIARGQNAVVLLAGRDTGALVLAQATGTGKDMNTLLRTVLDRLGGKGGGTPDFARGALGDPARVSEAIDLAVRLL